MVALDTNVLVRFLLDDHPTLSPKAHEIIEQATPNSLLVDRLVIEELGYVLAANYEFAKPAVIATYYGLLTIDALTIPDRELVELTIDLFASEKPLSFEDCWLLALYRSGKVDSVATFDTNLAKRAKTR